MLFYFLLFFFFLKYLFIIYLFKYLIIIKAELNLNIADLYMCKAVEKVPEKFFFYIVIICFNTIVLFVLFVII